MQGLARELGELAVEVAVAVLGRVAAEEHDHAFGETFVETMIPSRPGALRSRSDCRGRCRTSTTACRPAAFCWRWKTRA